MSTRATKSKAQSKSKRAAPRKRGRPTLLTPELQEAICAYIARDDMYAVVACALCNITEKTYYRWIERGRDGEEPYASFCQSIKEAEAQAELQLSRDMKDDPRHWQMYMTIKERRFADRWAKRERVQHEQEGDFKVILEWSENGNGNGKRGK